MSILKNNRQPILHFELYKKAIFCSAAYSNRAISDSFHPYRLFAQDNFSLLAKPKTRTILIFFFI